MRTTIRLDDALLRRAKAAAAVRGVSLNSLIADAVRAALAPRAATSRVSEAPRARIPTFKGRGLRAGVDLDDSSALADLMKEH
jgi:hypothetical protein